MATSRDHDKETAARPNVTVDDLEVPEAVAEHTGGGNSGWSPVTLKRGMTNDSSLFEWRQGVING
jgi:hypothetical protein